VNIGEEPSHTSQVLSSTQSPPHVASSRSLSATQHQILSSSGTKPLTRPEEALRAFSNPNQPHATTPGTSENAATQAVPPDSIPAIGREKSSGNSDPSGVTDKIPSRPSEFNRTIYNTFTFSLKLVETLAEIFPVPGVKSAIATLNVTIERFDVRMACF
jgi:hypothetical protein